MLRISVRPRRLRYLLLELLLNPIPTMAGERKTSVVDETRLRITSVFTKTGDHAVIDHVADADEEVLVGLGYKQEFKRFVFSASKLPVRVEPVLIRAQRSLHLVLLLRLLFRPGTAPLHCLDPDLQLGLLRPSGLRLGLDRRRCLDSVCRLRHGRAVQ